MIPREHQNYSHLLQLRRVNYAWIILLFGVFVALGPTGCKAKKEAKAAEKARLERIAKARADLLSVINDQGSMSTDEKEAVVEGVKDLNLQDAEIQTLIDRAEGIIADERAAARRDEERPEVTESGPTSESDLNNLFRNVAGARNTGDANAQIRNAIDMFASSETPVLIIISQSGGQTDYDEPTTISKYLNYLKDTKNSPDEVYNMVFDANGKIKELELIKR
ncbi:hypothetical protein [Tunicatimonas pelagia]|uniref:hypothetical protein n=1 Tax=Tunicatimonas pelagia TaxID=931531 RepID=UPI0026667AE6|nr:hypothetical protein [Tunicatimonas pelagia]WKN41048.1 hypothetical protein P0M28_18610 [Tunicatimonas pelagia]